MFHGVGDGLGGDAQQIVLELRGQAAGAVVQLQLEPDVFGFGDLAGGLGDGSGQSGIGLGRAAQPGDAAAGFAEAGGGLLDNFLKLAALLGGTQLSDQGLQLHGDSGKTLDEGIVKLAGDAAALGDDQIVALADSGAQPANPQLIESPGGERGEDGQGGKKPDSLIQIRGQGELHGGAGFIAQAIAVAGGDAKAVIGWGEIRIISLAAGSGVDPVTVVALEHVAESQAGRAYEAEPGVVELNILLPRGEVSDSGGRHAFAIDDGLFNDDRGRRNIAG